MNILACAGSCKSQEKNEEENERVGRSLSEGEDKCGRGKCRAGLR